MKWEYRVIRVLSTTDFDPEYYNAAEELHDAWIRLHAEGQQGWELVSVDNGVAYFKRAIGMEQEEFDKFVFKSLSKSLRAIK